MPLFNNPCSISSTGLAVGWILFAAGFFSSQRVDWVLSPYGLDVAYELTATYYPRDYCVQYGESDFDFVSRLMEEEGIYYFFKHSDGSHQMVVTDSPSKHPTVPGQSRVIYEEVIGEDRTDMRVTGWDKTQTIRAGEFTAWDYCFELPDKNLEAIEKTIPSVTVGKVTHKLHVGGNDKLEIYQYPGCYARRFDGINKGGAPQPQDLNNIFPDRARPARSSRWRGISTPTTSIC